MTARTDTRDELFPDERRDVLSIGSLMSRLQATLAGAFPRGRGIWVRGEIQSIDQHRSGHCYLDLVDPDSSRGRDRPVLKVNCWRTTWGPIRRILGAQGITLQPGMVVTLRGRVELYPPRAQINFIAAEMDVSSLLGRMAAQRAALLAALEAEGLIRRNAGLVVPSVPLVVGLVASPGSEGFDDFLGQLTGSGFAFRVCLAAVTVQGVRAPSAIANGLAALSRAGCDLAVLVRGGGAKADLAAFDSEIVARAICNHATPVWTGIGHTGDQSVADVVANRAFVTPTECGQELVRLVTAFAGDVATRRRRLVSAARRLVDGSEVDHRHARQRLVGAARAQTERHAGRAAAAGLRVGLQVRRHLDATSVALERRSARLGPLALNAVEREEQRLAALVRLFGAYDVERQLERGYTLTLDVSGRVVRSAGGLHPGDTLVTRFADGRARSVVQESGRSAPQRQGSGG